MLRVCRVPRQRVLQGSQDDEPLERFAWTVSSVFGCQQFLASTQRAQRRRWAVQLINYETNPALGRRKAKLRYPKRSYPSLPRGHVFFGIGIRELRIGIYAP